jgi:hypothetical protein
MVVGRREGVCRGTVAPNGVMVGRLLFLQMFSTSGVGLHSGTEAGDLSEMPLATNFKQFDI